MRRVKRLRRPKPCRRVLRVSWPAPSQGHELNTKLLATEGFPSPVPWNLLHYAEELRSHGSTAPRWENLTCWQRLAQDSSCILKPKVHQCGEHMHCVQVLLKSWHASTEHKLELALGQHRRALVLQFHFLSTCTWATSYPLLKDMEHQGERWCRRR